MSKPQNSRIITIHRTSSLNEEAQTAGAAEFMDLAKRSVGSYWHSSSARLVGTGLNLKERDLLMPEVLQIQPGDREYLPSLTQYFHEIKTDVPKEGTKLEIGLLEDNAAPISAKNMPINVSDYIRYRHALGHPFVASSQEKARGNQLIQFYVSDPTINAKEAKNDLKLQTEALELYLKLTNQEENKVDMMLTLMQVDVRVFLDEVDPKLAKLTALKKLADTKSVEFVKTYKTQDFEIAYTLEGLVKTTVFKRIADTVVVSETRETIGNNQEEAIAWLKNPINSQALTVYKSKMQEAMAISPKRKK
jgi:hypothetical protein